VCVRGRQDRPPSAESWPVSAGFLLLAGQHSTVGDGTASRSKGAASIKANVTVERAVVNGCAFTSVVCSMKATATVPARGTSAEAVPPFTSPPPLLVANSGATFRQKKTEVAQKLANGLRERSNSSPPRSWRRKRPARPCKLRPWSTKRTCGWGNRRRRNWCQFIFPPAQVAEK
jgi:hypothetical protein